MNYCASNLNHNARYHFSVESFIHRDDYDLCYDDEASGAGASKKYCRNWVAGAGIGIGRGYDSSPIKVPTLYSHSA
jgi:hypothetical protein